MNWKAMYNSIFLENKTQVDRQTIMEWNLFLKLLGEQSNNNTKGIEELLKKHFNKEIELEETINFLKKDFKKEVLEFLKKQEEISGTYFKSIENIEQFSTRLENKTDLTLMNPIKTIWIIIPENIKHGFHSAINFKTIEEVNDFFIMNNSNFDLVVSLNGNVISSVSPFPNRVYNLIFYSDGLKVYCYYSAVWYGLFRI